MEPKKTTHNDTEVNPADGNATDASAGHGFAACPFGHHAGGVEAIQGHQEADSHRRSGEGTESPRLARKGMPGINGHHGAGHTPDAMAGRFSSMPPDDRALFVIRRLDVRSDSGKSYTDPIRTPIHCFIFLLAGEMLVNIGEQSYLFRQGECAVIPAGQVFSVKYYNDCTGYMGGFHTDFLTADNEGRNVLRAFPFLRKWGGHKARFEAGTAGFIGNIFERLLLEKGLDANRDVLKAYLTTLLVEIDRVHQAAAQQGDVLSVDNAMCNKFLEEVFEYPDLSVSVSEHAARMNVSATHLQKTVKRLTGKAPSAWITESVVLEAKSLLKYTDLPVGDVSEKVGIHDSSYFTRLFRKWSGMAPLAYRKNPD